MTGRLKRRGTTRRTFIRAYAGKSGVRLSKPERSNPVELDATTARRPWHCVECGGTIPFGETYLADRNGTTRLHLHCGKAVYA